MIGALIIEQIEDSRPREGLLQRIEIVSDHSSLAMANVLEHNDLFLMPVWRAIGKSRWLVEDAAIALDDHGRHRACWWRRLFSAFYPRVSNLRPRDS